MGVIAVKTYQRHYKLFVSNIMNLIFVCTLNGVLLECPNNNELPVLNDVGDAFYCAWNWDGWGNPEPIQACNGEVEFYMDDYDHDNDIGWYTPVESLIVKAGCTFYGWEGYDFSGTPIKYYGPA